MSNVSEIVSLDVTMATRLDLDGKSFIYFEQLDNGSWSMVYTGSAIATKFIERKISGRDVKIIAEKRT